MDLHLPQVSPSNSLSSGGNIIAEPVCNTRSNLIGENWLGPSDAPQLIFPRNLDTIPVGSICLDFILPMANGLEKASTLLERLSCDQALCRDESPSITTQMP